MRQTSQLTEIIEGLQIVQKYYPSMNAHFEHDEIVAGGKELMPEEAQKRMEELGWIFTDEEVWLHF